MWVMVCAGMWAGEKIGLLKGRGLSLLLFVVWFFMLFFALFVFFVCWVVVLFWVLLICLLFGCFGFVDGCAVAAACASSSLSFSLLLVSFGFSVDFSAVSACGGVTSWMSVVSFECVTLVSGLLSLLLKYFWCIWSISRFQSCSPTVSGLLIRLPVKYFPTEVRTH